MYTHINSKRMDEEQAFVADHLHLVTESPQEQAAGWWYAFVRLWKGLHLALRFLLVVGLLVAPLLTGHVVTSIINGPPGLRRLCLGTVAVLGVFAVSAWAVSGFAATPWDVMVMAVTGEQQEPK